MTKVQEKIKPNINKTSLNHHDKNFLKSKKIKKDITLDIGKILLSQKKVSSTKRFNTMSYEEELNYLQNGKIPPEVIYTWDAGKKLLNIDKNWTHIYTLMVNNELWQMVLKQWSDLSCYFPKLRKCLWKTNDRLDIGTWNWIVSNMMAFSVVHNITTSRRNQSIEAFQKGDLESILNQPTNDKPNFISCDLSPESLSFAESLANDDFHDLSKFFNLKYYPDTFQNFLKSNNWNENNTPKLITMFNVLSNFSYEDLNKILQDMYKYMGEKDVFIPSFFQIEDKYDKSFKNIYSDLWVWFRDLSLLLYNNPETKDRIMSSFCDRYNISPEKVIFDVRRNNDWRDFIDVSLFIPENESIRLPSKDWHETKVKIINNDKTIPGMTKFNVFKSYRMSQKEITELCESVWFKIERFLDTGNWIQTAPVLYK